MAISKILADCTNSARRHVDQADSPYEAATLERNVAGEMRGILGYIRPTADQQRHISETIDEVNEATRVLAQAVRVPSALDQDRDDKAEEARNNVRKKLGHLDRLLDGVELSPMAKDIDQSV